MAEPDDNAFFFPSDQRAFKNLSMPDTRSKTGSRLPRLPAEAYRGKAAVHWTMTIKNRTRGWLDDDFASDFKYLLLHALVRYRLLSPAYCLMPDHIHLFLFGLSQESDQNLALRYLRRRLNSRLTPFRLQKQSYDHVLREDERKRGAFQATAFYVFDNPVRKRLTRAARDWPFSGCVVPGYPDLNVHSDEFWPTFWKIHQALSNAP